MFRKYIVMIAAAFAIGSTEMSCTEDIPDCPNKLCVLSGGWKLQEVQLDGDLFDGDYISYELILNNPAPANELTAQFFRTNISGDQDSGSWSIENSNPHWSLVPSTSEFLNQALLTNQPRSSSWYSVPGRFFLITTLSSVDLHLCGTT